MVMERAAERVHSLPTRRSSKVPQRRTTKVSESVAWQILHDIAANDLPPETKLPPESEMLETYRVGRASLREGLRLLEVAGIIVIRPGPRGGPMVADLEGRSLGR